MGLGAGDIQDLRSSSRYSDPFFSQLSQGSYNSPGTRDLNASPAQGFIPSTREASRNFRYSVLQPNTWRSALGLENQSQTDWRTAQGEYSTPGSVRGRTGYSGFELFNPSNVEANIQPYTVGDSSFGGYEKGYDFSYNDNPSKTISRAGRVGGLASDSSGVTTGQTEYSLNEPYSFSDSGNSSFGKYGGGSWGDQGSIGANLQPGSGSYQFDNNIRRSLAGSGSSTSKESMSGEGLSDQYQNMDVQSTGGLEGKLTSLGITAAGKLAGMGVSAALTAANLAALSNPATALIGLATLPISYFGGKAIGRLMSGYRTDTSTDTKSNAEAGLTNVTGLGLTGPGSLEFNKQSNVGAGASTPSVTGYGNTSSDVFSNLAQRASMRVGPESSANIGLIGDVGGVSDTLLREHEIEKKSKGNWSPQKSYSAHAGSAQSQQAALLGQANVLNKAQMARQSVPTDWVTSNVNKDIIDNFDTYRQRYPGLYGNYANADDFITREYFRQNPQAAANFGMTGDVSTISNAIARTPYEDAQIGDLDFRKEGNQNVDISGNINLSGPGGVNLSNLADISSTQRTNPQAGAFGSTLGYNTSSVIDANLQSQLNASLNGLGAQADAVNQMKFNFNNNEYGATLQLQAQRFINNLEEQLPQSMDSVNFINSLRNNPELVSLFEQGLPPETIVKATMEYDNANKTFKNQLDWEQNQNYQAAQVYDPTPEQPNSGDEMSLANIFGSVRQLDPGKLYDIGYKDVLNYNTDYKLPTPLTNQSNEYLADTYNWNKELANNMYYFTPGQNEAYNALANEFINRRYNLQDQFDTGLTDQYLSQIGQEGFDLGGYTLEDFQNLQNLLNQERQYDINGAPVTSGQMSQNFYLPEQVNIDPRFKYTVEGVGGGAYKGFYTDPRAAQLTNADILDKYYNYDKWRVGQKLQDEQAMAAGLTPGTPGSGSLRIDPVTGKPLTAARELTPEEFAQTQIERGQTIGDISGNLQAPQYTPQYETRYKVVTPYPTMPWYTIKQPYKYDVGKDMYNQAMMDYNSLQGNNISAQQGVNKYKPVVTTVNNTFGIHNNPLTKVNYQNNSAYEMYQTALNQKIQEYLAQNQTGRPI